MQELGYIKQIVSDPAHELSDLLVVEERERKLLVMLEDLGTHVIFHLRTHNMTDIGYVEVG